MSIEDFKTKVIVAITESWKERCASCSGDNNTLDEEIIDRTCYLSADEMLSALTTEDLAALIQTGIKPVDSVARAMQFWENFYERYEGSESEAKIIQDALDLLEHNWPKLPPSKPKG